MAKGLKLTSRPIVFGEIPEFPEGYIFSDRKEMMQSSFHRNWAAGIDGNARDGAAAIVISDGYEDDEDRGEEIIYTGAGGNDPDTGRQIADQTWQRGNAGLLKSMNEGLPVRVIRGFKLKSRYAPKTGYQYAGLYSVVDAWEEKGKSGFKICRFRLEYSGENPSKKTAEQIEFDYNTRDQTRKLGTILRIVRDTKIAHDIKKLYNYECQVCGVTIITPGGRYAEGAHIRPLGRPHNGEDNPNNVLCLCPIHHVMFDKGCFSISENYTLIGDLAGQLHVHQKHRIRKENLLYHREKHGLQF